MIRVASDRNAGLLQTLQPRRCRTDRTAAARGASTVIREPHRVSQGPAGSRSTLMSQVSKYTVFVWRPRSACSARSSLTLLVVTLDSSATLDITTPFSLSCSLCSSRILSTAFRAGSMQKHLVMPQWHCWRHMSNHQMTSMMQQHQPQHQQHRVLRSSSSLTSSMTPRTSFSVRPSAAKDSGGMSLSACRTLKSPQTHGFMTTMSTGGHPSLPFAAYGFETARVPMKNSWLELMVVRERGAVPASKPCAETA
mmetsp:Transcript_77378/g.240469  ORF Transcript_77378/g.240469 Transcript_77378/m.240469 type:complete len:252 (+) Transcript_77378:265-1020(+)